MKNRFFGRPFHRSSVLLTVIFGALCSLSIPLVAQTAIDTQYEDALNNQVDLLAPQAWIAADKSYKRMSKEILTGQDSDRIAKLSSDTRNKISIANDRSSIAKPLLQRALNAREKAQIADAETLAIDEWQRAEKALRRIASELERNKTPTQDQLQNKIATVIALYDGAELDALTSSLLIRARGAESLAAFGEAKKYAPETYTEAETQLKLAVLAMQNDRYNTAKAKQYAAQAAREFKHAIQLTLTARQLRNKELSTEQVLLDWEARIDDINEAAGLNYDPLDNWDIRAAELVAYINESQQSILKLQSLLSESRSYTSSLEDELRIADQKLGGTLAERDQLIKMQQVQARNMERLMQVEQLFSTSEATILRKGNNIILRLMSIQFASGSSKLNMNAIQLLSKVEKAIEIFPGSAILVEGHTDASGPEELNNQLSEDRANTVMRHMIKDMRIETWRLTYAGFGSSRPIASNTSASGRAKNRRIDLIITPPNEPAAY